eukprot:s2323_g4.t1
MHRQELWGVDPDSSDRSGSRSPSTVSLVSRHVHQLDLQLRKRRIRQVESDLAELQRATGQRPLPSEGPSLAAFPGSIMSACCTASQREFLSTLTAELSANREMVPLVSHSATTPPWERPGFTPPTHSIPAAESDLSHNRLRSRALEQSEPPPDLHFVQHRLAFAEGRLQHLLLEEEAAVRRLGWGGPFLQWLMVIVRFHALSFRSSFMESRASLNQWITTTIGLSRIVQGFVACRLRLSPRLPTLLLWPSLGTGPLAAVFNDTEVWPRPALDIEDILETAACRPLGPEPSEVPRAEKRAFTAAWSKDSFRRNRLPEQDRFNLVYQEWLQVVLPWVGVTTVLGLMLAAVAIVSETLGGKALSTLENRLRQVKAFLAWALLSSVNPFPMTEHLCRMYLKKLVDDKAPASRIKGVLEMVGFLRHVVGLPVAENAAVF